MTICNVLNNAVQNKDIKIKDKIVILSVLIVIFILLLCCGGIKTYPDTESYLSMSSIREPGYGLVLNGAIVLFGKYAFIILGLLQSILAVFSIYYAAYYFGKSFNNKYIFFAAAIILLMPYVVTPLFASSGIILTNAMISEGVTLSLYNLFFVILLKVMWEEKNRNRYWLLSLVFALLLSLFRGQMLVTLIAWFVVALMIWIREKNKWKGFLTVFLFILAIAVRTLCINGCNYIVNGKFTGTTYGSVTILSNIIYVSDRETGEEIEDEKLRKIFYDIYDIADEGGMLYKDAPDDFSKEASFYSKMHDEIKDRAIYPYLQSYTENVEGIENYMDRLIRVDELSDSMIKELLTENIGAFIEHYFCNVAVGLIRTVSFVHPFFNFLSFMVYVILISAWIYGIIFNRDNKIVKILFLTLLLTIGNVTAVAMTIMCLSRYMIYNMAFIYISVFLLFLQIFSSLQKHKKCSR